VISVVPCASLDRSLIQILPSPHQSFIPAVVVRGDVGDSSDDFVRKAMSGHGSPDFKLRLTAVFTKVS
jgi:hypothetical protein